MEAEPQSQSQSSCPKCNGDGVYRVGGYTVVCPCQKRDLRAIRRKYSGLPTFTKRPWLSVTRDYLTRFREIKESGYNWIMFCGRTGTGKSTQAFMIVDALLSLRNPVEAKVYIYSEIVRELTSFRFDAERYNNKIEQILDAELVVFDDFLDVIPKAESFEEQTALTLIKRRYVQRLPLVITTELEPRNFGRSMPRHGEALVGRIYEMCDGRIETFAPNAQNYRFSNMRVA